MSDRLKRAASLGFTLRAYHGTAASFNEFDLEHGNPSGSTGHAPYFADSHDEAKGYADKNEGNVHEFLLRIHKPFVIPARQMGEYPARKERLIPKKLYQAITGGSLPDRNSELTAVDALRQATRGADDRREAWNAVYGRLRKLGFDAIVFTDTPSDFKDGTHTKIVMLDLTGIRLVDAEFAPGSENSKSITA